MAVVQISKIQIRRGQKGLEGIPQLASGELAWCIDTKQLYIGGGTEAEGANQEENVEILTRYSDILGLGEYSYREGIVTTGRSSNISRSIQSRLDDRVNAHSFGIIGLDGTESDSEAINRAIERLYKDSLQGDGRKDLRAVLEFSPGVYTIDDPIYVYSYTKIVGAGQGRTIFRYNPTDPTKPAFIFVDDSNNPSQVDLLTQCKNVSLKEFTLEVLNTESGAMDLFCTRNSEIRDIELKGIWTRNDVGTNSSGINLRVRSDLITCKDNDIANVKITGFKFGVWAKGDIANNTIRHCEFSFNEVAVNLGYDPLSPTGTLDITQNLPGQKFGPRYNIITNSTFNDVQKHAVKIWQGRGNIIAKNTMSYVGNNFGGNIEAVYGQIEIDIPENYQFGNYSDRHYELAKLGDDSLSVVPYVPEVTGKTYYENSFNHSLTLGYKNGNPLQDLFRFPLPISSTAGVGPDTCSIEVNYFYRSDAGSNRRIRKGVMTLIVDIRSSVSNYPKVNLIDDYDYIGVGTLAGDPYSYEDDTFIFEADTRLQNNKWQIVVSYKYNTTLSLSETTEKGIITYTYKVLS